MMGMIEEVVKAVEFTCSFQFWRMAVLWTLSLVYSYLQLWFAGVFFQKSHSYPRCSHLCTKTNKQPICVITGATSGLGRAAAYALSSEGYFVVLAGRSTDLLLKTVEEIKQQHPDAHLKAFQVDLSSFQSVLKFKNSLNQWLLDSDMHPSVQLLINNAGILATSRRFTTEGYERMMGTNYIGQFLLTNLLLPLLKSSLIPSRIVNVTSFTHRCVSNLQADEEMLVGKYLFGRKQYPCAQIYECTKFFLLLFSYRLHQQLFLGDKSHQVSVIAADPGVVDTNIMREVPSSLSLLATTVLKFLGLLQSPENGVKSIIDASLAPPDVSGVYFFGGRGRTIDSSTLSYDTKLAEKLWSDSYKLFADPNLGFTEASWR